VAILLCSSATTAQAADLNFCLLDDNIYPVIDRTNADKGKPGVWVEFGHAIARRMGLTLKVHYRPGRRCLREISEGTLDGILGASYVEEREAFGAYPMKDGKLDLDKSTLSLTYNVYQNRGAKIIWDGTSLDKTTPIFAPLGWSVSKHLKKMGANVRDIPNPKKMFEMLKRGRVNHMATLSGLADIILESGKYPGIIKTEPPIRSKPYYIMLSRQFLKTKPKRAQVFWDTIPVVKEEELEALLAKY